MKSANNWNKTSQSEKSLSQSTTSGNPKHGYNQTEKKKSATTKKLLLLYSKSSPVVWRLQVKIPKALLQVYSKLLTTLEM